MNEGYVFKGPAYVKKREEYFISDMCQGCMWLTDKGECEFDHCPAILIDVLKFMHQEEKK